MTDDAGDTRRRKQRNSRTLAKDVYRRMNDIVDGIVDAKHAGGLKIKPGNMWPINAVFTDDAVGADSTLLCRVLGCSESQKIIPVAGTHIDQIGTVRCGILRDVNAEEKPAGLGINRARCNEYRWSLEFWRSLSVKESQRRGLRWPFLHVLEMRGQAITWSGKKYGTYALFVSLDGIEWHQWRFLDNTNVRGKPERMENEDEKWFYASLGMLMMFRQFFWVVRFKRRGVMLDMSVDRVGAREVLAYRDLESGISRRRPAIHWVKGRMRNDGSVGPAFMRGNSTFEWNGFECKILTAKHDEVMLQRGELPETDAGSFLRSSFDMDAVKLETTRVWGINA